MSEKRFRPGARASIPWGFLGTLGLEGIASLVEPCSLASHQLRTDDLRPWMVLFDGEEIPVRRFLSRDMLL